MPGKYLYFGVLVAVFAALVSSGCVQTSPGTAGGNASATYTLAEVSQHSARSDCWMAIHGKVYDVTSWIPTHPGRDNIIEGCGKDATEIFETRPMGSGTPHSQNARNLLSNYYIGELA